MSVQYQKYAETHKRRARDRRNIVADYVRAYKDSHPCADCGVQYRYWIMQFDHVRGVKVGNVGEMAVSKTLDQVKAEIDKCEIVCANCHSDRSFKRLNYHPI